MRWLALLAVLSTTPAHAHCHIYSVWHYPKPQKCFTALAPGHVSHETARHEASFVLVKEPAPNQERIEIPLPPLDDITWGETGSDQLRAIALLRQLMDAPSR